MPKGSRVFSLDMADMALGKTYEDNRAKAATLKASATTLSLQWNAIETSPDVYADPGNALATANAYFPAHGIRLSLTIRSVDTVAIPIPGDLVSLQIGNEIDLNPISSAAFWANYQAFVDGVAAYAHAVRPRTKVGFMVSAGATSGSLAANILAAAAYGLGSNPVFSAYLQTLGLQNYDGSDKPAVATLRGLLAERGW